jgi:hypothetical protein
MLLRCSTITANKLCTLTELHLRASLHHHNAYCFTSALPTPSLFSAAAAALTCKASLSSRPGSASKQQALNWSTQAPWALQLLLLLLPVR